MTKFFLPLLTALVTMQVPDDVRSAYPDDTVRAALASLVSDSFTWLKDLVRERRKLDDAKPGAVAITTLRGVGYRLERP